MRGLKSNRGNNIRSIKPALKNIICFAKRSGALERSITPPLAAINKIATVKAQSVFFMVFIAVFINISLILANIELFSKNYLKAI